MGKNRLNQLWNDYTNAAAALSFEVASSFPVGSNVVATELSGRRLHGKVANVFGQAVLIRADGGKQKIHRKHFTKVRLT